MRKITFASQNKHKTEEINLIAKNYDVEFVPAKEGFDPVEDGQNFIQNAVCKVKASLDFGETELFLADDSGLCIDALDGAPGIFSARYANSPKERIERVLKEMADKSNRRAQFVCAMVLMNKKGEIVFETQKECAGEIIKETRGINGFGYDPIFLLENSNKTMAELEDFEKAQVSHRALALKSVLTWLEEFKD